MSWINCVVQANSENEAPERFFYWAAISSISAVMRKNVFLDRFYYKLYPNINVFIVAKSGMKKGVPVVLAKNLVSKAGCTRVISGRNSMPAIIKDLGKSFSLEGGGFVKDAHGFLISGELAAFLVKDPDALTILTDLHDTHAYEKEWINTLKVSGVDKLKSPCISLLGATNEDHFVDAVPQNAIGGGFIARTFIVYSEERGTLNSLTQKPTKVVNTDLLAEYLVDLSKCQGEFKWGTGSADLYDKWYYPFMKQEHQDPTGTMNRIGDQVLKVAMCLSLAESPALVLEPKHVQEAIAVSLDCIAGMRQITMGAGKSSLAYQTKLVLRTLITRPDHQIERAKLLQIYWGEFDAFDLDKIIETLQSAGAIDVFRNGKKTNLVLKKSALDQYTQFKRQIQ